MIDEPPLLRIVLRLGVAFVLGLPIGWNRERRSRSAGLRTYPLLSVCICGFLLLAQSFTQEQTSQADVFYGVLTGVGFVGYGAIVTSSEHVAGMSTAVSLWLTGAIGAGAAYGIPLVSAALSLMTALAMWAPSLVNRRRGRS